MLNKELLMVGEGAPEGSIVMTVGEYNNIYGYGTRMYGSVNKIPLWYSSISNQELLFSLTYDYGDNTTSMGVLTKSLNSVVKAPQRFAVTVTINGRSNLFMFDGTDLVDAVKGDIYDLFSLNGTNVVVTFDPPPDGYLDPETLEPIA